MRALTSILLTLAAPLLLSQQVKKPRSEWPENGLATFQLRVRAIPTVRLKVNGTELLFGVDTGCQGVGVLTPAGAALAKVAPAFSLPTMGNSGRSESTYGLVETLEGAGVTWRDFHMTIMPLDGMNIHGLMGADLLFERPFYMDLTNKVMTLGKVPDTSSAHEVACYSRGGHCGVNITVDGAKIPMIIDSGASKSYLCSLRFKGKTTFLGHLPVATVRGTSLSRVEVCQIADLRIGNAPLTGVEFLRDKEHNLLGNDFFRSHPVAVDMPSRRMWLFESQGKAPVTEPKPAEPAR
ncbi:MAG: aspartyl protease family protein [Opitutia bacterium]